MNAFKKFCEFPFRHPVPTFLVGLLLLSAIVDSDHPAITFAQDAAPRIQAVGERLTPNLLNTSALFVRGASYDCARATDGQLLLGGGELLACDGTDGQHYLYKIQIIDGHMFISFQGVQVKD